MRLVSDHTLNRAKPPTVHPLPGGCICGGSRLWHYVAPNQHVLTVASLDWDSKS